MSLDEAGLHRKLQLQELEEIRLDSYENAALYKEKTKAWHDKMISRRSFEVGKKVLVYQSRLHLFLGKLKSRWVGPFVVTKVFPHGAVEIQSLELGKFLKVNGQRLKLYYDGFQIEGFESILLSEPIYED
ncbi:uncharacterized protein LOC141628533 [Silene latifolia]|uniref:uncharacterized protein LOC141628533 n=1 Tax=Silene latifolia TaxID=37657 RepID=UPI003D77B90E